MDQVTGGVAGGVTVVEILEVGHQYATQGGLVERGKAHFREVQHCVAVAQDGTPQERGGHDVYVNHGMGAGAGTGGTVPGRMHGQRHCEEAGLGPVMETDERVISSLEMPAA